MHLKLHGCAAATHQPSLDGLHRHRYGQFGGTVSEAEISSVVGKASWLADNSYPLDRNLDMFAT